MLLFLLRFILAVFSFRFFSLGFLRTEREREREEKTFRISFEYTNQVLEDRMLHEKNHNASYVAQVTKTKEINHGWRRLTWI